MCSSVGALFFFLFQLQKTTARWSTSQRADPCAKFGAGGASDASGAADCPGLAPQRATLRKVTVRKVTEMMIRKSNMG